MFDKDLAERYVTYGLLTKQEHPQGGLFIYNYTAQAQFSKAWDTITLMCRGLITDKDGNILYRPFGKFFNFGERGKDLTADTTPVSITEKLDGSLGILYQQPDGTFAIATRGSFKSEQALKGTEMLQAYIEKYGIERWYNEQYTYLFEIIYPQNRIVVDYGQQERLVLLAVIDKATLQELDIDNVDYQYKARVLPASTPIEDLALIDPTNKEGFVVRYNTGLRLKFKFDEYVRLHRIVTRVQPKDIWELLRNEQPLDEWLDGVPDEFYDWVYSVKNMLTKQFDAIVSNAAVALEACQKLNTRKEAAELLQQVTPVTRAAVFAMLDGKDEALVKQIIWRSLKPKYQPPYKVDIDA